MGGQKSNKARLLKRGRRLLFCALATLALGFYYNESVVLVIGLNILFFLVLCRFLCAWNFRKLSVERHLPLSVFCGESFAVELLVSCKSRSPAFCISIKDSFLPEKKSHFLKSENSQNPIFLIFRVRIQ